MSDFDNFESAAPTEEDPAAEFLAREQDQLAGLEDDGFMPAQPMGNNDFGMPEPAGGDMFDPMMQEPGTEAVSSEPAFGEEQPNESAPVGDTPSTAPVEPQTEEEPKPAEPAPPVSSATEPVAAPTPDAAPATTVSAEPEQKQEVLEDPYADPAAHDYQYAAQPSTQDEGYSGFSAISQADKQRAEPEKIRIWREEQKTMLEEKDAESEKRKAEWREVAKRELEDWYKHRAEQFEKTKVNNREHEASLIQERDESVPGHEWERICRLCEFNPKHSGNKKDVGRQRSILLQLKQTPLVR